MHAAYGKPGQREPAGLLLLARTTSRRARSIRDRPGRCRDFAAGIKSDTVSELPGDLLSQFA
jgi:hypothetical protein